MTTSPYIVRLCYDATAVAAGQLRHHSDVKSRHQACPSARVDFDASKKAVLSANNGGAASYAVLRRRYVEQMRMRGYSVTFQFCGVHSTNDRYIVHYSSQHDTKPVDMAVTVRSRDVPCGGNSAATGARVHHTFDGYDEILRTSSGPPGP